MRDGQREALCTLLYYCTEPAGSKAHVSANCCTARLLQLRMRDDCLKRYYISCIFFCKKTMLTSIGTVSSLAARTLVEQPSLGHAVIYTTPVCPPFQSTPATSPSSQGFILASTLYKGQTFSPHLQFLPLSGQRKLPSTLGNQMLQSEASNRRTCHIFSCYIGVLWIFTEQSLRVKLAGTKTQRSSRNCSLLCLSPCHKFDICMLPRWE